MATERARKTKRARSKMARAKRAEKNEPKRSAQKRLMAEGALTLSERARAEVAKLLNEQRAGTITGEELQTGLEEVIDNLKRMLNHILASL